MRWKWEAKLRLHVNGKIVRLGLWDRFPRGIMEACSSGLEQPDRGNSPAFCMHHLDFPQLLWGKKLEVISLLGHHFSLRIQRNVSCWRLRWTAALGILIYPRILIFNFSCLYFLTSCLQCLSKFIVQFYYSLFNNCSFTLRSWRCFSSRWFLCLSLPPHSGVRNNTLTLEQSQWSQDAKFPHTFAVCFLLLQQPFYLWHSSGLVMIISFLYSCHFKLGWQVGGGFFCLFFFSSGLS